MCVKLADHQRLTLATEVDVYFCDPPCPRQRGLNEHTNRLLRQHGSVRNRVTSGTLPR